MSFNQLKGIALTIILLCTVFVTVGQSTDVADEMPREKKEKIENTFTGLIPYYHISHEKMIKISLNEKMVAFCSSKDNSIYIAKYNSKTQHLFDSKRID